MKILKSHTVTYIINKTRLLDYSLAIFSDFILSKSMLKKTFKKNNILLNNKVATGSEWVENNDIVSLLQSNTPIPKPFNIELKIVYEDSNLAVIIKPAGIVVSGNKYNTITNAVQYNIKKSLNNDALDYPRPVHRLDSATSGLLLIAKTQLAAIELGKQLENKTVTKRYRAILVGKIENNLEFTSDIDGKKSHSKLELVKTTPSKNNGFLSLVDLYPLTGRTHQLRIHTSENGHSILGDKLYSPNGKTLLKKGLFLSAVEITFTHPETKEIINISIDQPSKFDKVLSRELGSMQIN